MNKNMAIGGLGNGLDSLFNDNISDIQVKKTLRISEIEPNRDQPRKNFSDEAIAALADSIRDRRSLWAKGKGSAPWPF